MNVMNNLNGKELKIEERALVDRHGRSRIGNYMHLADGRKYFPFDPKTDEINIEVISHHLACAGRWQGATRHKQFKSRIFYSVAEHSVCVASYMIDFLKRPDLALEALLHDASEAYIGDLIRPLKYSPEFRAPFLAVEEINEQAIAKAFNLVYPFPPEIKMADEAVTETEHQQIIYRHPDEEWTSGLLHEQKASAPYNIDMLDPFAAKELFLIAYHDIISTREKYRELPKDFRV